MNHANIKFKTRFLLISVNMIYTNEAKQQDTEPWPHRSAILF